MHNKEKQIKNLKDESFKQQKKLMDLREKEANLYSDIQGTMAALRNLQAQINKLHQELSRQQELLYNAEYQIQLLERRVARANGERTTKETAILNHQIEAAEDKKRKAKELLDDLIRAIKNLTDERRNLERNIKKYEEEKEKETKQIEKLNLENDMTTQELNKIIKEKENTMVQHDIMKLEILKIQERLKSAQNDVLERENKKNQLELALSEKEKEISVHKAVLLAEYKAAEQERHKIAVELAKRQNMVKNNKIKFESLIQSKQGSNGANIHEHSQAYYMIKAGQEKEELQRKEDELNAKILKAESEKTALQQTKAHLMNRNTNYRDYFENRGWTRKDVEQKQHLDDQLKIAGDNLIKKRTEYQKIKAEIEENQRVFTEGQSKLEILYDQSRQAEAKLNKVNEEFDKQADKRVRAGKFLKKAQDDLKKSKIEFEPEKVSQTVLAMIEDQTNLKKTLHSIVQ